MLTNKQHANLSPLAVQVYQMMEDMRHVTAHSAFRAAGITSASLSRRICDLEGVGVKIKRSKAKDPVTKRPYTRYSIIKGER